MDNLSMDNLSKVRRAAGRVANRSIGVSSAQAELELAIREAHEAGESLRSIGRAARLSHEKVRMLLLRDAA
jgi:hypothetical protein